MPLSANEQELLAVIRYFNNKKKNVGRLLKKLEKDHSHDIIADMTGFTPSEIRHYVNSLPKAKPKASVKPKAIEPKQVWENPIKLNSNSDLIERLAHEMAELINNDMSPGEKWLSVKDVMERYECGKVTATKVNAILREHNFIQPLDGNVRNGYVVI